VVKFEFIRMPDSTGFGDYTESGQVIPVTLNGEHGGFVLSMFLNDHPPIAAGRELWGFPKKLGQPDLRVHTDTLMGTLDYSEFRIATGTMGFKHRHMDHDVAKAALEAPAFLLKIIPHVDGTPRICELVRYSLDRRHRQGRLDRPRRPRPAPPRAGADRRPAGAGDPVDGAHHRRPSPRAGRGAILRRVALVLQGGGALGAYQAGVYEALAEAGIQPDLARRHLDRRHQRRHHRRQSAGAAGRCAARILGDGDAGGPAAGRAI
jgi:hypothetical protein